MLYSELTVCMTVKNQNSDNEMYTESTVHAQGLGYNSLHSGRWEVLKTSSDFDMCLLVDCLINEFTDNGRCSLFIYLQNLTQANSQPAQHNF